MNDGDRNEFIDEFKKADGTKKLDMWYYALEQEVLWEDIIANMSEIAKKQKVDKKLDKMLEEDIKKIEH